MGIRMLNRRTATAQADAEPAPAEPSTPVPVFAADASTARIPTDLAATLHRTAAHLTDLLTRHLTPRITPHLPRRHPPR
ncbi:hypothetical protein ACIRP3_31290 [Streptomyces sp. NPDC101209]|uniref:hypothetical protein n=1 Tax=Streptomyces sp. NPDC101209 TaxID=3366129 RepID=UPI00381F0119